MAVIQLRIEETSPPTINNHHQGSNIKLTENIADRNAIGTLLSTSNVPNTPNLMHSGRIDANDKLRPICETVKAKVSACPKKIISSHPTAAEKWKSTKLVPIEFS